MRLLIYSVWVCLVGNGKIIERTKVGQYSVGQEVKEGHAKFFHSLSGHRTSVETFTKNLIDAFFPSP